MRAREKQREGGSMLAMETPPRVLGKALVRRDEEKGGGEGKERGEQSVSCGGERIR